MALTDILLRIRTYVGWSTKGSELDMEELDDNLIEFIQQFQLMKCNTNITPYDASFTYQPGPPTAFVSYGTNDVKIYAFIDSVPQTGVTPGTAPLTWALQSFSTLVGLERAGGHAVTTAGTTIAFSTPLGSSGSDYALNFWCYNSNGDTVICLISARTKYGFTVTPAENGTFEYIARYKQ